nr:hypothetical protein [Kibdelosporangium sp. MJ126-NF4]
MLLAGVVMLVGINDGDQPSTANDRPPTDPEEIVTRFASSLRQDGSYRPPTVNERKDIVNALTPMFGQSSAIDQLRAADSLRPLGFTMSTGNDPRTGRQYALVINERDSDRAWGAYMVDLSRPVRLAIEVPHPNSDLGTERIGLKLFRDTPGAVLLMAGTHRRVERGDMAHRTDSVFHAVATELAKRDVPQVQIHGFHDDSLPDTDVVVSPGAGKPGATVRRIADRIADTGLATCRSWESNCGKLEGTSNEQGKMAAERESTFLHVETSRSLREDEQQWTRLVGAIAEGLAK